MIWRESLEAEENTLEAMLDKIKEMNEKQDEINVLIVEEQTKKEQNASDVQKN